jgi:hypothetical protein
MLFKQMIAVYKKNYARPVNKNAQLLIGKAGGIYSYH